MEKLIAREKGFRKLLVWQRAHNLVLLTYGFTEEFPKREMFGLSSQLQRAAVSIPAYIAEGYAAGGNSQFGRYLRIAQGSLAEVEYYLILARDLCYLPEASYIKAESLRREVGYLLHRLLKSLERSKLRETD